MNASSNQEMKKYVNAWSGRLRAVLLEFIILWEGAYSTKSTYPYSIAQAMEKEWGPNTVPLTTVYSAIKRLEGKGLINVNSEIVNGRVQKIIMTQPDGFDVLKILQKSIKDQCGWFSGFEKDRVI